MSYHPVNLSQDQLDILERNLDVRVFLEGPAGCGKTTVGVERMLAMMATGIWGDSILLLVPQRTLAGPYYNALQHPGVLTGGMVAVLTVGGLAQRMVDLFWPLLAEQAGFSMPDELPVFLTLETAQYYMAHLTTPLLEDGYFETVTMDRNRLFSQIIDNLNKAAVVGFPYTEIGERLKAAWTGDPGQVRVYDDVQFCATSFREYCLAHNLLDFSLQIDLFYNHLWPLDICRDYLGKMYRHLIVDNLEEDTPISHDLLAEWLPEFESALLIYDKEAGYRRFLGADTFTAYRLKEQCDEHFQLAESFVSYPAVQSLNATLSFAIRQPGAPITVGQDTQLGDRPVDELPGEQISELGAGSDKTSALWLAYHRFYPEMLDWVADQIQILVNDEYTLPSEIVVMAPYLSDALRFSLINRLEERHIPVRSHRPSRSLREEPAMQCMLTLATLAFPGWGYTPSRFDFAYALVQAIDGLDLIRAQLLAAIVYREKAGSGILSSFDLINPAMQSRITYRNGERYEQLREWLEDNKAVGAGGSNEPFDYFLSRLFGELLSQPGFGFHNNYRSGEIAANLIESVFKFRRVAGQPLAEEDVPVGKEYLNMVQSGVVAAQYVRSWQIQEDDSVLITPAHTFLMGNRPVDIQFWLDIGSRGWYQRLNQPLTQPFVLSRSWPPDRLWADTDELQVSQDNLIRLTTGLLRRCRHRLYLGLSDLGEAGYEHRGTLLHAFQRVLRQIA